jgi:5-methyltetrahydrofolate--homocysteine methyltransferase
MTRAARVTAFRRLRGERILVLDGALGTMIQVHKLSEADYRGWRFHDRPSDAKGNNDRLTVTRPQRIRDVHGQFLSAAALATA